MDIITEEIFDTPTVTEEDFINEVPLLGASNDVTEEEHPRTGGYWECYKCGSYNTEEYFSTSAQDWKIGCHDCGTSRRVSENKFIWHEGEKPSEEVDVPVVSGNEIYQQEVINLLSEMKGDIEDVKRSNERLVQESQRVNVYLDNLNGNSNGDSVFTSVSSNIMTTPINEYNLEQSLLLFIGISMFIACVVLIVKKGVGRWR